MDKTNAHIATARFDFQQNLLQPHIPVGIQLWFYVFGVHNCGTNQEIMYCAGLSLLLTKGVMKWCHAWTDT